MKYTYNYNSITKEFIYSEIALIDPLESKHQGRDIYLLPANATFIEPIDTKQGFAIIWNGENWEYIEDNRNTIVWKSYDESMIIKELGPIPEGWSIERPEPLKPTQEEIIKGYEFAVQRYLDETAQSKGYDNTYTCLSYLNSTNEKWKTESTIFNSWRDSVWQKCHEILNAFIAGELTQPTIEEVIEALPKIEW